MILTLRRNKRHDCREGARGCTPLGFFGGEMDRVFEQFFNEGGDVALGASGDWVPPLDVTETDTELTVRVEVPGVEPADLDITIQEQILTLSGQKKEQEDVKEAKVARSERRFGSFTRSIQLPTPEDKEQVTAEHKNGVVLISLKKMNSAVPRRIPVQAGGD